MSRQPCPNAHEGCPLYDTKTGCFSDIDHIVPKRLGTTALARFYILNHPENRQRLCRAEHDEKTRAGDEPLPSDDYMREAIAQAVGEGILSISNNRQRKLGIEIHNGSDQREPITSGA